MKHILSVLVSYSLLLLIACNKSSAGSNAPYYLNATINGKSVSFEAGSTNSQYECGISFPSNSLGPDVDQYVGTTIQTPGDPTTNAVRVYQLKRFNHVPSNDEMAAMWSMGAYNYGQSNISNSGTPTVNGASVTYYDENGDEWNTERGAQTGSTFTVTELVDNPDHSSAKIFTAKLTCNLYNDLGQSIKLQNGILRGKLFVY